MIRFDKKIVGFWYLETIPGYQDWMASVREIEPERKYEVMYRFRYYKDDKVFDSKDRKNWYRAEPSQTRAYVVAGIRAAARKLEEVSRGGKLYELMNDGDFEKFKREFENLPFVFMRMEKKVPE
jgi:hypothetical protein